MNVPTRMTCGMSSFPVELVYAEQGVQPDERGSGTARIDLPVCSEPIMHLMVELHVPARGRYRDFAGTLHEVRAFTPVAGAAIPAGGVNAAQVLQQQYQQNVQAGVSAAGASPIDVQLPLSGSVYRLEKILVLGDAQWFSYAFSRLAR